MCIFDVYAGPLCERPSIKRLREIQVSKWHKLGGYFHLTKDQMQQIKISQDPSTETFLAAQDNGMELRWIDILQALLSIDECELAGRVVSEQG